MNHNRTDHALRAPVALVLACAVLYAASPAAHGALINRMDVDTFDRYPTRFDPGNNLLVLGEADTYHLDDGSHWESGAGWHPTSSSAPGAVSLDGTTVQYQLALPPGEIIFQNTDYNFGSHSAQGVLVSTAPLVLTATVGSKVATLSGFAEIASNDITHYGLPRFNYYAAAVGDWVPFDVSYTLLDGKTWDVDTFNSSFRYNFAGVVDFSQAVPEPATLSLLALGGLAMLRRRRGRLPATLYKLDVTDTDPALIKQIGPGSNGQDLEISRDGEYICYACGSGNGYGYTIFKLRTSDLGHDLEFNTGPYPREVTFGPEGDYVYAVHTSGEIDMFHAQTGIHLDTFATAGEAHELIVDNSGEHLFAAFGSQLRVYGTGVPEPTTLLLLAAGLPFLLKRRKADYLPARNMVCKTRREESGPPAEPVA